MVYEWCKKIPEVVIKSVPDKLFENDALHDAGYDSGITGYSFIKMMHFLLKTSKPKPIEEEKKQQPNPHLDTVIKTLTASKNSFFEEFQPVLIDKMFKLNLTKCQIKVLNLVEADTIPNFDNTFIITVQDDKMPDEEVKAILSFPDPQVKVIKLGGRSVMMVVKVEGEEAAKIKEQILGKQKKEKRILAETHEHFIKFNKDKKKRKK